MIRRNEVRGIEVRSRNVQIRKYAFLEICKCADMQIFKYAATLLLKSCRTSPVVITLGNRNILLG